MQGEKQVVKFLNRQLCHELTAINQYFLHARMYDNWGFGRLGKYEYKASIQEMKRADKLIARILLLEGLPNLQNLNKLLIGENVPECIRGDLDLETIARASLREAISHCETARDFVSRDLLEDLLENSEERIDFLETQLELIVEIGKENYLQTQIQEDE
ncbi:MAG: bacterioferritin [Azoarcus sp.]|jgi:bacterioferritin|nr:bacterioferritin [Azoarcus sp.]